MTSIEITVQSGSIKEFGTKTFTLKTSDTVRTLRETVARAAGLPAESIRLVHSAALISKDDALLEDFPNITKGNVMFTVKPKNQGSSSQAGPIASPLPQATTLTAPMSSHPAAPSSVASAEPSQDVVQHLVEVTRRSESMVRLALRATGNNAEISATLLMEFGTEEALQEFFASMISPQTALNDQTLEQILANPGTLNQFSATVASISPNLATRFNSDRALLLDVFRLVLYLTSARPSRASSIGSPMRGLGPSVPMGSRPHPAYDEEWTEEDDINMARASEVVGQDLDMDRVKELYLRLGRDMDALISAIIEQLSAYLR
ncbi:Ubiquitin-like protein [Giardia muris]|uniref:Ubiquitin-like protein n=1 Tax=Giardia muris TaxID=5742 RepID=A0A4Z1SXE8_GIAMU|nr:Ubiquitin-like protein [Giardia muris]|eukprot:TNJ26373.1 Ubiquitin-like protein [Giardia muris]